MPQTCKKSYTVPCASAFRDAVSALAASRGVNVGDLARSILLALPHAAVAAAADPGDPPADDRETVILKSGPAAGRPWRRKPRLQVRMADDGTTPEQIRRALGLALALAEGTLSLDLADPARPKPQPAPPPAPKPMLPDPRLAAAQSRIAELGDQIERLRAAVDVLAFSPLVEGVRTREEALHVLGFPPGVRPAPQTVRARFRMLATIHHPDSITGSHERMSQLNAAIEVLRRHP